MQRTPKLDGEKPLVRYDIVQRFGNPETSEHNNEEKIQTGAFVYWGTVTIDAPVP